MLRQFLGRALGLGPLRDRASKLGVGQARGPALRPLISKKIIQICVKNFLISQFEINNFYCVHMYSSVHMFK